MHNEYRLTYEETKEMRDQHAADIRVWQLMDLITAEFESDPTSVQCFDLRLVREAVALVKRRRAMRDPFNPFREAVQPLA